MSPMAVIQKVDTNSFIYINKNNIKLPFMDSNERLGIYVADYEKNKGVEALTIIEAITKGYLQCIGNFTQDEIRCALTTIVKASKKSTYFITNNPFLYMALSLGKTKEDILKVIPNRIINFPILFWNTGWNNSDLAIEELKKYHLPIEPELVCLSECKAPKTNKCQFFNSYYTIAGTFSDGIDEKTKQAKHLIIYKRVDSLNISFQKIKLDDNFLSTAKKWEDTIFDNKENIANILKCFVGGEYAGLIEFIHWPSPKYKQSLWLNKMDTYFKPYLRVANETINKTIMIGDWNIDLGMTPTNNQIIDNKTKLFINNNFNKIVRPSAPTYSRLNSYFDWAMIPNSSILYRLAKITTLNISPCSDHNAILLNFK